VNGFNIKVGRKHGYDVVLSLREMKEIDLDADKPVRKISAETEEKKAAIDQKGKDIEYNNEHLEWQGRKSALKENLRKTCAYIYDNYCTHRMQSAIKDHPNFSKIEDDPILLLQTIRNLAHNPVRATYPIITATHTMLNLINIKQYNDETLIDYVARFKGVRDEFKQNMGTKVLHEFIEKTKEYEDLTDSANKVLLKDQSWEKWLAWLFLKGSDQAKYGSVLAGLKSQFSLKNEQYPVDLAAAIDALQGHKLDNWKDKKGEGPLLALSKLPPNIGHA